MQSINYKAIFFHKPKLGDYTPLGFFRARIYSTQLISLIFFNGIDKSNSYICINRRDCPHKNWRHLSYGHSQSLFLLITHNLYLATIFVFISSLTIRYPLSVLRYLIFCLLFSEFFLLSLLYAKRYTLFFTIYQLCYSLNGYLTVNTLESFLSYPTLL